MTKHKGTILLVTNCGKYCRLAEGKSTSKGSFKLYDFPHLNKLEVFKQLEPLLTRVDLPGTYWYLFTAEVVTFMELLPKQVVSDKELVSYQFPYSTIETNALGYNLLGGKVKLSYKVKYETMWKQLLRDRVTEDNLQGTEFNPEYILPFGKFTGYPLKEVPRTYINWMKKELADDKLLPMLVH
jgi:hypothetical protein